MFDVGKLQQRVGVKIDGDPGPGTMGALFARMGAKPDLAAELGLAAAVHFRAFGILDNGLRLAHFMGETAAETEGFLYMEEIWGPTPAQRGYEGRDDLGNTQPGDGFRFKGRGPIQETGRANYRRDGRKMGIDIERHPDLVAIPSIGLWVGCLYWDRMKLNQWADNDDTLAVANGINRGNPAERLKLPNGWDKRQLLTKKAKQLIF